MLGRAHQLEFPVIDEDELMSKLLESAVLAVVDRLTRGEYSDLVKYCESSRLTADELKTVVMDYGRTLAFPPPNAYGKLDAVKIDDTPRQAWSVRAPIWTLEEGRSDLTIELTVILHGDRTSIELDDLHVL